MNATRLVAFLKVLRNVILKFLFNDLLIFVFPALKVYKSDFCPTFCGDPHIYLVEIDVLPQMHRSIDRELRRSIPLLDNFFNLERLE